MSDDAARAGLPQASLDLRDKAKPLDRILEGRGGTVSVESQGEGFGATFTVAIPLRTAPIEADVERRSNKPVTLEDATADLSADSQATI